MNTVQEVKAAIERMSANERQELIAELPKILPELDGDAAWERIINDARPRAALTALLNDVQAEYRVNPARFASTSDAEFDRQS